MKGLVVAIDARLVAGTGTGDSTYWTGLLHGFAEIHPDARILLYSPFPAPSEVFAQAPFEWIQLPMRNARWWSLVRFPLAARRAARVIHSQYSLSPLVGPRGITTIHDVSFLISPEWFRPRDRFLLSRAVPASARRAAAVITVSETSRQEIYGHISGLGEKVHVTLNACPPWVVRLAPDEARAQVRSLGIEEPYVLSVSTRWPRKNMELAVKAMEGLPSDLPHRLVLSGKAGWGDQSTGGRTRAVGYLDSSMLGALYSAASLYLCPSRHEGFGVPLLEAFRCGCPVICSSGGALPEVSGGAALVEPKWDASHWTATIERTLRDPGTLADLRERGLAREKQFSWAQTARRTLAIYEQVAR